MLTLLTQVAINTLHEQTFRSLYLFTGYLKKIMLCCLWLFLPLYSYGQNVDKESKRTLTLHFSINSSRLDVRYMENAPTLSHLDEILSDTSLTACIDSINIYSFASPDGRLSSNRRLALKRSVAVKTYLLRRYPQLDARRMCALPQGENWQGLRELIMKDENFAERAEALAVIDSVSGNARCKLQLKKLNGGHTYRYIAQHILPQLRNAAICAIYLRKPLPAISAVDAKGAGLYPGITRNSLSLSGLSADSVHSADSYTQTPLHISAHSDKIPFPAVAAKGVSIRVPLLALKTNLLFDVALMPNFEVEVPIGNRWSLNGELMFPWWLMKNDKYCLQILMGGLEGRWWAGNRARREVLTGHFLGLYAGGGKYDLQYDRNGYQGEFFIAAGVSYGYAHRIARNLRLEYSIGLGLLRTDYRHYHARDHYQTLLWQENGRYTWLGPTKVKISLVWMLNRKKTITNP